MNNLNDMNDKLNAALQDAVAEFNDCSDPSMAVAKTACAYGFEPPATKRLMETFNRARTLYHFETAMDKTAEFSLADPEKVFEYMHVPAKKAACVTEDQEFMLKAAYYSEPEKDYTHGGTGSTSRDVWSKLATFNTVPAAAYAETPIADRATRITTKLARSRHELEHARDATGIIRSTCDKVIQQTMRKIAEDLRRMSDGAYDINENISLFKEACARNGLRTAPKLLKDYLRHEDVSVKYAKVINTGKVAHILGSARVVEDAMWKWAEARAVLDIISNEYNEMEGYMLGIASDSDNGRIKQAGGGLDDMFTPGETWGKQAQVPAMDAAISTLMPPLDEQDEALKSRKGLINTHRKLLLEDLLAYDPILSKQDPEEIALAYKNIVNIAPDAANNKAVVASMLRQSVMGTDGTVSPYDAHQLAKLNQAMLGRPVKDDDDSRGAAGNS